MESKHLICRSLWSQDMWDILIQKIKMDVWIKCCLYISNNNNKIQLQVF